MQRGRARGRVGLLLAGLLASLAAGEVAIRALRLDGFAPPDLRDLQGRPLAKLSELERFFAGEGVARGTSITQFGPGLDVRGWYDRPEWDYFDAHGCVTYRTNSLGFRDDEFPLAKPAGELRVLAIGDSFTFGFGVQAEDTWVERLERQLQATRDGPVEVINGGAACGLTPPHYAAGIAALVPQLDPDAVLIGLCLNDVSGDLPMFIPTIERPEPLLGGASRLLLVAQQAWAGWKGRDAPPPKPLRAARFLAAHSADWNALTTALTAVRDLCARERIRFVVVVFPMLTQLAGDYPFAQIHQAVVDFCAEARIECLDTLPPFLGREEQELWVHPTDQHMNDLGHSLLADTIGAHFKNQPILPRLR